MRRSWYIPRRTVLTGAGACIGLPLLEAMVPRRANAATTPQCALFLWHPNGIPWPVRNPIAPGSVISTDLTAELAPVADYVSYVAGFDGAGFYQKKNNELAKSEGKNPAADHCGFVSYYTGTVAGANPALKGVSIDQVLAMRAPRAKGKLTDIALIPSLRNGQNGTPESMMNSASWRGPNDPVKPTISPAELFKKVFSRFTPGSADPAVVQLEKDRLTKGRLVLDVVTQRIKSLKMRLGRDDNQKLDQYLTGVEEIDRETMRILSGENAGALTCTDTGKAPSIGAGTVPTPTAAEYLAKMAAFQDLTVKILECDIARVMTFMHGPVAGFMVPNFSDIVPNIQSTHNGESFKFAGAWHGLSHGSMGQYGGQTPSVEVNYQNFVKVVRWNYKQVATLAGKLMSVKLPGGENLLDRTLISYGTGINKGAGHVGDNLHQVLIGRGGGAFKTKVHIRLRPQSLMNLWLTVMRGFELPDAKFGQDSTGIIPGLLA